MNSDTNEIEQAIQNSYAALNQGNRTGARYWAQRAAWLAPDREDPWLVLAVVSSPHASLSYLQRALKINPDSERAQTGLRWAQERLEEETRAAAERQARIKAAAQPATPLRKRSRFSAGKVLFGCSLVVLLAGGWLGAAWMNWPEGLQVVQAFIPRGSPVQAEAQPAQVQASVAAALTQSAPPTRMATATQTPPPTATSTPLPTQTPEPTLAPTVNPTELHLDKTALEGAAVPDGMVDGQKRVLVDISEQHLYAYEGDQVVYSFVASTGQGGGTLTGTFPILDKIENAYSDPWGFWMPDWLGIYYAGPDLENGIHSLPVLQDGSEIWGNDIGKPITYGCVVLGPQDAKMLYNWVDIGTPVIIQN